MSLAVAIPAGVASAVAYGAATGVQHSAVGELAGDHDPDGRGLLALLRDPRWWLSIAGDTFGLILQLVALASGPVVLVQPLFVLCLPVALPIRARFGGAPPSRSDYLYALLLCVGLSTFFMVAGTPADGRELTTFAAGAVAIIAVAIGGLVLLCSRALTPLHRAITVSAVCGAWFGTEAVLVNAVSSVWRDHGGHALRHADGLVPLIGAITLGVGGFALSQFAFHLGSLGASLPAMLVTDPVLAVVLGALLLGEGIDNHRVALVGYVLAVGMIVLATVRLASPLRSPGHPPPSESPPVDIKYEGNR